MDTAAFGLGLILGLGICLWQRYRVRSQLKPLLNSLPDTQDLLGSLSLVSLVRREIVYLKRQCQQREADLDTWQELLDLAPTGFLWLDGDNQLLWCNRQARELLKLDRWQAGKVRLLLELVRSYELDQIIQHTRESQKSQTREWQFHPSHPTLAEEAIGKNQLSSINSVAIKASSYPLPLGQVGIFLENQQPLRDLAESRERAFSDLSHELRTPLTAISLVAEALLKRLQGRERDWVGQMLQETNRLMQLVQGWLELSQLQENASRNRSYQGIDLREAILSAWQSLQPLALEKGVNLAYGGAFQPLVEADRDRLVQVFINLFDNSLQYSPPGSEIRVQVRQAQEGSDTICIDVIDGGTGFSEADLPHIFERFYRGDPSRTRAAFPQTTAHAGSGLGLAIAREIIAAHGGSISASNHPETGGAWLQLSLPVRRPDTDSG